MWVWGKFPFLFADVSAALLRSGFATLYEGGNAAYSLPVTVLKAIEFEARYVSVVLVPGEPLLRG